MSSNLYKSQASLSFPYFLYFIFFSLVFHLFHFTAVYLLIYLQIFPNFDFPNYFDFNQFFQTSKMRPSCMWRNHMSNILSTKSPNLIPLKYLSIFSLEEGPEIYKSSYPKVDLLSLKGLVSYFRIHAPNRQTPLFCPDD